MSIRIDIFKATSKTFLYAFETKDYWWRWCLVPFFFVVITALSGHFFSLDEEPIWFAIFALPKLFISGWLASKIVRLYFFDEKGPLPQDKEALRALTAGVLISVLVNYISAAMTGIAGMWDTQKIVEEQDLLLAGGITALFIIAFWAIRYMWLYIPAAAGLPLKYFLKRIIGWKSSFQILVLIACCWFPVYFAAFSVVMILNAMGLVTESDGGSVVLLIITGSVADVVLTILVSIMGAIFVKHAFSQKLGDKDTE